MKLYVQRKFCAAHKLVGYQGPCGNLHGHTFLVEVWLNGEVSKETGMVVDFKDVKNAIDQYDHTYLNALPDFLHFQPTAEVIALRLYAKITGVKKVRVWESDDCFAQIGG